MSLNCTIKQESLLFYLIPDCGPIISIASPIIARLEVIKKDEKNLHGIDGWNLSREIFKGFASLLLEEHAWKTYIISASLSFFFWGLTAHMHHLVFGGSMVPINMGFKLYLLIFLFIKFVVIKFIKKLGVRIILTCLSVDNLLWLEGKMLPCIYLKTEFDCTRNPVPWSSGWYKFAQKWWCTRYCWLDYQTTVIGGRHRKIGSPETVNNFSGWDGCFLQPSERCKRNHHRSLL